MDPDPIEAHLGWLLSVYGDAVVAVAVMEDPPPVSINKMYTTYRGKRALTKKGEKYRDGLASLVARSTLNWKKAHEMVYKQGGKATLLVRLYFPDLTNSAWRPGSKTASGAPQQPHRTQDVSNYIKLIEDSVVHGSGIDDCNNIVVIAAKYQDRIRPRTEVIYVVTPP